MREVFPNCPRYIHKYQLVERSKFVPHAGVPTPVPAWKRYEWAKDVLPAGDPAKEKVTASADLRARLHDPHLAPAVRVDELAGEDIAGPPLVAFLARQLQTVRATRPSCTAALCSGRPSSRRARSPSRPRADLSRRDAAASLAPRRYSPGRRPAMRRVLPKRSSKLYDDRSGGRSCSVLVRGRAEREGYVTARMINGD